MQYVKEMELVCKKVKTRSKTKPWIGSPQTDVTWTQHVVKVSLFTYFVASFLLWRRFTFPTRTFSYC